MLADILATGYEVDATSTATLLRLIQAHQIDAARFVTHRFALEKS
jgi:hypothetical protein